MAETALENIFDDSNSVTDDFDVYNYLLEQYKLLASKAKNNPKFGDIAENLFLSEIDSFYRMFSACSKNELGSDLLSRYFNLRFYHYTSYECLKSIINSKQLWLSRCVCDKLNDSEEMKYYLKELSVFQLSQFLTNYFIFSVSCNKDDAAQWDRYGDCGKGVCIEFKLGALERLTCNDTGYFYPIIYNNNTEDYAKFVASYVQFVVSEQHENDELMAEILAKECLRRKHPSFKNEKEFRLIVPYKKKFKNMSINELDKLELDISNELSNNNFITKIILGPEAQCCEKDIIDLFNSKSIQFNIDNVEKSKCTLVHN